MSTILLSEATEPTATPVPLSLHFKMLWVSEKHLEQRANCNCSEGFTTLLKMPLSKTKQKLSQELSNNQALAEPENCPLKINK